MVRGSLRNRKAISFALDQVLASPPPPVRSSESKQAEKAVLGVHADRLLRELRPAMETQDWRRIESLAAEALRLGGIDEISEGTASNQRVDLAVWSDALQPIMGNPLLVEVKGSLQDEDQASKAARQLSAATAAAGTGWGLLLHVGDARFRFPTPPNVLVL
jgi:hypothetical protein